MCKPQLTRLCLCCNPCSLLHGHMLLIPCLFAGFIVIITIHSFADEKICTRSLLYDLTGRPCICCIGNLDSFSFRSHYHIACIGLTLILDCLSILKMAPVLHRKPQLLRSLRIKLARSVQLKAVAVAEHVMIYLERLDPESCNIKSYFINRLIQFDKSQFKRKSRCNHKKRPDHMLDSLRSYDRYRLRPVRISYRKEQTGKTTYMIRMKMCYKYHIYGTHAPSSSSDGYLRCLSTVNEHTASIISKH